LSLRGDFGLELLNYAETAETLGKKLVSFQVYSG
jgi:hypothetical protein